MRLKIRCELCEREFEAVGFNEKIVEYHLRMRILCPHEKVIEEERKKDWFTIVELKND